MRRPHIPHPRWALAGLAVGIGVTLAVILVLTTLADKNVRIDSQGRTIDAQGHVINEKDQQIRERDQKIDELNKQLESKREERSRLARLFVPTAKAAGAFRSGSCSLDYIRTHESGGNYQAKNGQYTGAYQQSTSSWQRYGDGSAPTAGQASPASQDAAAQRQYAAEGSRPWSVCG